MSPSGNDPLAANNLAPEDQRTLIEQLPVAPVTQGGPPEGSVANPFFQAHASSGPTPLSRLAEYEVLKEIGRGGMGVVFKARHVRLGRTVALKMILGGSLARPEDVHRFENEAAAAGQLQHSGIVTLYEVGTHENQPFFSMEYISGTNLAQRVEVGPVSSRKAAKYMEVVAQAVHYAHSRGIVHRDLKPGNVLLDENDQPKVTDFGLAKLMATDSGQTRTGAVLGTPSYMSPEQAAGRKDTGPASDIYSLDAILYELLTGKPPFRGETPLATLTQVAEQEPIPPRLLNPEVDRDVETICLKCLEKDMARRYRTAEALAQDLRRFLDGVPITARRVSVLGRAVKWCPRNPAIALMACLAGSAMLGFMVFFYLTAQQEKVLRERADTNKLEAMRRQEAMRYLLYDAEIRRAFQAYEDADLDRTESLMKRCLPRTDQSDLRDWEWYFLNERCKGPYSLKAHKGRASAVAFRPDGQWIASAGGDLAKPCEIKIWNAADGQLLATLLGHTDSITSLAFNHDGTLLASGSFDKTVKIWDLEKRIAVLTLTGHPRHVASVAFSPKGRLLASAGGEGTVRIWDYVAYLQGGGNAVKILKAHTKNASAVAFSPSGHVLASGGYDGVVRLWDPNTGEAKDTLKGHEGEVHALAFSPSGQILASGGGKGSKRGEVRFWETDTGKLRFSRYSLSDRVLTLAFSRDSKLAAGGSDGLVRVWDQALSSEADTYRADMEVVYGVAFSPDGQSFAAAGKSGRIGLYNTSGGLETRRLATPGQMEAMAFGPRGRLLACAGAAAPVAGADGAGDIRVFNLDVPGPPLVLKGSASPVDCLAFSPDGKRLAVAGADRQIRIFDLTKPDLKPVILMGHEDRVRALAFRPDGATLASGGEDYTIRLWQAKTGVLDKILSGHGNSVLTLAWSPDGRLLASGSVDMTVKIWNLQTNLTVDLKGHTGVINAVAFSPDGLALASGSSDRTIRVWDLLSGGEKSKKLESSAKVLSVAYHPHGRRLVSAGQDKIVRLWDLVTGQEVLELSDTAGNVRAVSFSADGRFLAAAGLHVCRIWDAVHEWRKFSDDGAAEVVQQNRTE